MVGLIRRILAWAGDDSVEQKLVFRAHPSNGEVRANVGSATQRVDRADSCDCLRHLFDVVDDESGFPVDDDLWNRALSNRNHRRSAGHGLHEHQSTRFGPADRVEQTTTANKYLPFLLTLHLTN